MNPQDQYQYQPPRPVPPMGPPPGQSKAIASLVCGIVAMVLPIPFLDLAAGIVGLVLAGKARQEGCNSGMRTAGFVVSLIGTIYAALFTLSFLVCAPFLCLF